MNEQIVNKMLENLGIEIANLKLANARLQAELQVALERLNKQQEKIEGVTEPQISQLGDDKQVV